MTLHIKRIKSAACTQRHSDHTHKVVNVTDEDREKSGKKKHIKHLFRILKRFYFKKRNRWNRAMHIHNVLLLG